MPQYGKYDYINVCLNCPLPHCVYDETRFRLPEALCPIQTGDTEESRNEFIRWLRLQPRFLTTKEAAKLIGVSLSAIRNAISHGWLKINERNTYNYEIYRESALAYKMAREEMYFIQRRDRYIR